MLDCLVSTSLNVLLSIKKCTVPCCSAGLQNTKCLIQDRESFLEAIASLRVMELCFLGSLLPQYMALSVTFVTYIKFFFEH